ncbi:MAG: glycoside hydrolase family 10 protein [Vampirovibrionales bacterium]
MILGLLAGLWQTPLLASAASEAVAPFYNYPLSAVNPSLKKVPFPGGRGTDQLVLYDARSQRPRTETNEFGYEVTVMNGRVNHAEGSNSVIPPKGKGFVLSGHGKASRWLLQHASLGADIVVDEVHQQVSARQGAHLKEYQLRALLNDLRYVLMPVEKTKARLLLMQASRLDDATLQREANPRIEEQLQSLQQRAWQSLGSFRRPNMHAVWLRPEARNRREIANTLDDLKKSGINTVFVETFVHGHTIYPSNVFETYGIENNQQYPKYVLGNEATADYLQLWLEEAHKRGMQYHAWLQLFYVGHTRIHGDEGPILRAKPHWANRMLQYSNQAKPQPSIVEQGYYFLDPANPEVRAFHTALVQDLVSRYPVDGIQLDYIRYPASPSGATGMGQYWGYTPIALEQFRLNTGINALSLTPESSQWATWLRYKANMVNNTVETLVNTARTTAEEQGRSIAISADIFPDHKKSYAGKQQEWPLWIQQGWLDFICPMTLATTPQSVAEAVKEMRQAGKRSNFPVVAGVFSPFYGSDAHALYLQLAMAQRRGANGFAIFTAANLTPTMREQLSLWQEGFED